MITEMDAGHAVKIRDAVFILEEILRQAAADGLTVRLELKTANGYVRGKDNSTRFVSVALTEIFRAL